MRRQSRSLEEAKWLKDQKRLDEFYAQQAAKVVHKQLHHSKLMEAHNEFWTCSAVWKQEPNGWFCSKAGPMMEWMVGMDSIQAKKELLIRGCSWKWL